MEQNQSKNTVYEPIQIILFFVLTFLISWSFMIPWAKGHQPADNSPLIAAGYGPFLAAVIVIWISKGRRELSHWLGQIFRVPIRAIPYLAGALILPFVIGGLHYGLYRVLGGEPDFSTANSWDLYVANLVWVFLAFGGNEEPGWRGFALPALLERFHPLLATLVLGVIHSAWHLPMLRVYGDTFGQYLFNVMPLTVILNWFYLKSHRSVIPVMLLHAGVNVISNYLPTPTVVLGGLGTWTVLRGMVYWVMAIVIVILTKGRLGANSNKTQRRIPFSSLIHVPPSCH
jgi:membrane protease YdiL (CAAX protease family)